ncbi:MAG TPA: hypothetical protein VIK77_12460 [Tissierellaceae bacterium]
MIKKYINYLKRLDLLQKIIHFTILISLIILIIKYPISILFILLGIFIFTLYAIKSNKVYEDYCQGNGIIFGGRGAGKGLLLNKRINTDKSKRGKPFCNVPYRNVEVINIKEYIDSIVPNTTENFINGDVKIVEKKHKFEGRNVYWDDIAVYAPNYMDNQLKKLYPSLSALLPINRHLYDAYMIITVQDLNRPYKLLRELQTDFAIKAIKSQGWGYFWSAIPFLNLLSTTKYIYYDNVDVANYGILPFKAKGVINKTLRHGILTAGQATKEEFEAKFGKIFYGRIWQFKRNIGYDTRYFHELVFGYPANQIEEVAFADRQAVSSKPQEAEPNNVA